MDPPRGPGLGTPGGRGVVTEKEVSPQRDGDQHRSASSWEGSCPYRKGQKLEQFMVKVQWEMSLAVKLLPKRVGFFSAQLLWLNLTASIAVIHAQLSISQSAPIHMQKKMRCSRHSATKPKSLIIS